MLHRVIHRLGVAAALIACVAIVGCNSHYTPTSRHRLSVVMKDGTIAYSRDGQIHRFGFLGRGLMSAVRGDPQAEAAARTFYERNRDGLLTTLAGLACGIVATGLMASKIEDTPDEVPTETWVALGCLVGVTTGGLLYMLSGQPYQYDAINIYNDNAERFVPPGSLSAPGLRP